MTEPTDIATIRHTLMTGLAHNAAVAALDRLAQSPVPAEPVVDAFKPMTASEVADAFLHRSAEPVQQDTKDGPSGGEDVIPPPRPWSRRWYGSDPYKGWSIMEGRAEIAVLGGDKAMERSVDAIVDAHNEALAYLATPHPVQPEEAVARDAETPSNKQRKLLDLADRIDHEQLWRWAGMDHHKMTPEQRDRMNAGVALRRYANLWAPGRWVVFPPVGPVHFSASTLDKAVEMAKRDEARAALSRQQDAGGAKG